MSPSALVAEVGSCPALAYASRVTPEEVFQRFFLPLYPPGVDLAAVRATDANPGQNPALTAAWEEAGQRFAALAERALEPARPLSLDFSDASVHRLGAALDRATVERLVDRAAREPRAGQPSELALLVVHGASYVGTCIVRNHGGVWLLRSPAWESLVRLASRAGTAELSPFSWWLRSLGDALGPLAEPRDGADGDDARDGANEGPRAGLAERYRALVEVPTFDAERLPVIAPEERRLPRLAKVRYDLLYKHLRAHLPELRDVGADFPSAARFEELGFHWLDLRLVVGGRMLLVAGPTDAGAHAFWLDASGFQKAAFFPAPERPSGPFRVERDGDVLRFVLPAEGGDHVHETLPWGP